MKIARVTCYLALLLMALAASHQLPAGPSPKQHINRTKVVLLGTGTPMPGPERSGPATAIFVDGSAYLVDFGPGLVRRAKAAVFDRHIHSLRPEKVNRRHVCQIALDFHPSLYFQTWNWLPS